MCCSSVMDQSAADTTCASFPSVSEISPSTSSAVTVLNGLSRTGGGPFLIESILWLNSPEPAELPDFVDDDEAAGGGGGPPDSFGFGRAAS